MTDHTSDPFTEKGDILPQTREAALNAALHVYRAGSPEELDTRNVKRLLSDADAIARFLNDGTLPR